ncbi:MAG: hypothetical protein IKS20_09405 [Victivallales bacterium]|nr:hypothetical protein [Victivallales bacterium]
MSFNFTCPYCQGTMEVEEQYIGATAKCPHCNGNIIIEPPAPTGENSNADNATDLRGLEAELLDINADKNLFHRNNVLNKINIIFVFLWIFLAILCVLGELYFVSRFFKASTDINNVVQKMEQLENKIKGKEQEIKIVEKEIEALNSEIQSLVKEGTPEMNELKQLMSMKESFNQEKVKLDRTIHVTMISMKEAYTEKFKKKRNDELIELKKRKATIDANINDLNQQINKKQEEMEKLASSYSKQIAVIRKQVVDKQKAMYDLREQKEDLLDENLKLNDEKQELISIKLGYKSKIILTLCEMLSFVFMAFFHYYVIGLILCWLKGMYRNLMWLKVHFYNKG